MLNIYNIQAGKLLIIEFSNAGNLIWTFNSSIGGVASISEIVRYDSEFARRLNSNGQRLKKYCKKYTLSIITSQLHCFQLRTTLNGKDFKFFFLMGYAQRSRASILLHHMHEKEFFILTNKCENKL